MADGQVGFEIGPGVEQSPLPLPGAPPGDWASFHREATARATRAGLDPSSAEHVVSTYGADVESLLELLVEDPGLRERILPGHPEIWAEVLHAVRGEMAMTVEDVLRRRLHLFYDAADGGVAVAAEVARRIAGEEGLGWSDQEAAEDAERYSRTVARARTALAPRTPG